MTKKAGIWATIMATITTAAILAANNNLSLQEVFNAWVNGSTSGDLHRYSTNEAANLLLQASLANTDRDSLVSEICLVMDDNVKRGSGTTGTYENMDTMRAAMFSCVKAIDGTTTYTGAASRTTKWHFPVTFTVEPQTALAQGGADTSSAVTTNHNFSIYDFRNFVTNYGCDVSCTTGFDEQGGWSSATIGKIASGNFTSYNQFEDNLVRGVKSSMIDSLQFRDLLPLGKFTTMSWSNQSATMEQKRILHKNGIQFAVCANGLASSGSSSGQRPNIFWPVSSGITMGLSGGANNFVSCMPGILPDRYEIVQALAETSDTATTMQTIRKCVALRGSGVVINLHNLALWSSNLQGTTGPGTVSGVMAILAKYQRQGRIRFVTFAQFCDDFYNRPISPTANWLPRNFADCDGDGKVDLFIQNNPGNGFPTNPAAVPTNGTGSITITTGGYGGLKEAALRWEGVSAIGAHGSVSGVGFDPEFNLQRTKPWSSSALAIAYPCPPPGTMAHIEFEARCDTTKNVALGDTVGVWWLTAGIDNWNRKQLGQSASPKFIFSGTAASKWVPYSSYNTVQSTTPEVLMLLAGRDRVAGPSNKYSRFEGEFKVPMHADMLWIGIWKGGTIQSQAIRISDVSLSFYKQQAPIDGN